ncbi:MAG: hypothetical protein P0Y56_03575 [Candidatus Andeanibacterium colombiense]|uniref:Uncharacterized protein n=1 Tax=Candidatus Andeanibacterium colombiense TaxID=3121345 RepID=A0AAJ6BQ54_9SPHN|nr:MAG: hypothetical protein P0Y56_03575 [Sphingomonadaceae bacterium]
MASPLAAVFSGVALDTKIDTASIDGKVTLGLAVDVTRGDLGSRVQVRYVVSTGHVQVLRNDSVIADFAASELSPDSNSSLALFMRGDVKVLGQSLGLPEETLELHVPSIGGVPLSYTRFGTYAKITANIIVNNSKIDPLAAFVFGQSTPNGSMPHTGSATYTSDLFGAVVVPNGTNTKFYTLGDGSGSATFGVNFGTGAINTMINLDTDGGGNFGTLNGTGMVLSGGPAFNGALTGAGTGIFTGAFFGPTSPAEMGYVFEAKGSNWITYGNVFGTKNAPPPPPP